MSVLYGGPVPLPVAIEDERLVCSMLLNGDVEFWEMQPLTPAHFAIPLHILIAQVASGDQSISSARDLARAEKRLREELNEIRDLPWVTPAQLKASVSAVLHAHSRRELCKLLSRIDMLLRLGELSPAEARRKIVEFWNPSKRDTPRQSSMPPAGESGGTAGPSAGGGVQARELSLAPRQVAQPSVVPLG